MSTGPAGLVDPFGPTADPAGYVSCRASEAALSALETALAAGATTLALSGPPGIGKTLVLRVLEQRLAGQHMTVWLPYAALAPDELFAWTLGLLGEPSPAPGSAEAALLVVARDAAALGQPLIVLIDDASALPAASAERVGALVRASAGAMRVVAAGLEDSTIEPSGGGDAAPWARSLGPTTVRIQLREPLSHSEVTRLLRTRLEASGAPGLLLARVDERLVARIHAATGGVPRDVTALASEWLRRGDAVLPAEIASPEPDAVAPPGQMPLAAAPPPTLPPTAPRTVVAASTPPATRTRERAETVRPALPVDSGSAPAPVPVARPVSAPAAAIVVEAVSTAANERDRAASVAIKNERAAVDAPSSPARVKRPPASKLAGAPKRIEIFVGVLLLVGAALLLPWLSKERGRPEPPPRSAPELEPASRSARTNRASEVERLPEPPPPEPAAPAPAAPIPPPAPPAPAAPIPPAVAPEPEAPPPAAAPPAAEASVTPTTEPAAVPATEPAPAEAEVAAPETVPPPAPAATAKSPIGVHINAVPWAVIEVDGVDLGETPLSDVPLLPGSHRFRARLPDGRVIERTPEISETNRHISFE